MVALNLIELFSIIFFLLFIIILLIAVVRRCMSAAVQKPENGDKRKSGNNNLLNVYKARSGQQITIPIQARVHHLSSTTSLPLPVSRAQNIRTIYLGTSNEVGNSARSVYTIPVSARDLRRSSVVVVLDRRSLSQSQAEQRPNTIQELSPPPSYDECIPPPQYSEVFP